MSSRRRFTAVRAVPQVWTGYVFFFRLCYTIANELLFIQSLEINKLAAETDEKLVNMEAEWNERLGQNTDSGDDQARFRNSLVKLAYRYSRLIVLSFGFQHSFVGKAHSDQTIFFNRVRIFSSTNFFGLTSLQCYNAASDVLRVFIDELSTQKVYLKHGPEAQCIFITFASSFLIKVSHLIAFRLH